jgi:TonB family protein
MKPQSIVCTILCVALPAALFLIVIPPFLCAGQSDTSRSPLYPDNQDGLVHLVKDLLKAHKSGAPPEEIKRLLQTLVLPDPKAWFSQVFGEDKYQPLVQAYAGNQAFVLQQLDGAIVDAVRDGYKEVRAKKYENSCDDSAGEFTFPLLMSRVKPVPLYELRMMGANEFRRISTFAYVDGAFRYVGTLNIPDQFARSQGLNPVPRVQLKGEVQAAKNLKKVVPAYPDVALREHLEGTVRFHAIIGRDGSVQQVRVVRGYCSLAEAALPAVRQWRYTPTLFNGEPVEVDTTIDVIFALRQRY